MKRTALAVVVGGVILASCSPTEYSVIREINIEASPEIVYSQVVNHKNRDAWSPWERMDPNMTKTYEGPEAGVGAVYKWIGNDSVGTGTLEITDVKEFEMIRSRLTFTSPWESTSEIIWNFEEADGGTKATWKVKGELPGYLFWMGQDDMDETMGPDFERGLSALKEVAESAAPEQTMQAELVTVESMPYYYIRNEISFDEMSMEFFSEHYGALANYLAEDMKNVNGPAFAIYHKWDEENRVTDLEVAMSCTSDKTGNDRVQKGNTYGGRAMKCTFIGPYEKTGQVHEFLHSKIESSDMELAGSPWEVYAVGSEKTDDPNEYVTEIYYPVKPKEAS